ncbi:hypothetical protein LOTGIDRAFT_165606 [Lottia gigantea]|uniref:OTU domain-containing protein n=1 Tax=Lottia gigantea TaxID=225164 RepID=V4BIN9_LOTGI|nr:hypothetical protein LOTGIDRAFT_165606 [Lottia gigantea]ESO88479.1 hypothetical protein LOTGIDRAFT_165606 [Lottia gigantea]
MHNASKFAANMDDYLMRLGLCRKSVVRDSSCLFRIISEQIYFTQALHGTVQKKCLEYLCNHRDELLNEPPIHCEMMALSKIYKIDILIFQSPDEKPVDVTRNGYSKLVLLCHVDGIHYDMVYTQSHIHGLAISQSIIYEVLYRGVFELDSELDEAVNFLRQQKKTSRENSLNESDHNLSCTSSSSPSLEYELSQKITLRLTPPLPYRIAKALDSTLYRNVAKDIVEEEKREKPNGKSENSKYLVGVIAFAI